MARRAEDRLGDHAKFVAADRDQVHFIGLSIVSVVGGPSDTAGDPASSVSVGHGTAFEGSLSNI